MSETIQILELFGGIGSPRCALRNLNIPTKAIDYVEINEKAVRSYNSMFREELAYKTQTVVGWNLKPDILIHGSPCQDMSIAGHQGKATGEGRINRGKGSDEGSGTRSSLMWETIHIIENMGEWRPRYVIWENVKNVKSKYMRPNFDRYMVEMERLGYTNNFEVLDAREFGLPQARERVFTVSVLNGERFEFDDLIRTPMRNLQEFLALMISLQLDNGIKTAKEYYKTIKEQQEEIDSLKKEIEMLQQEHEDTIAEIEQDAAVYVEENKKIANMTQTEDTIRLQTERDTYKTMYEQLLNRLVNGGAA
ncbi:DNA (cytosine-5-)-methyltransferase [Blautia luti]|uniref:DNA cytosine methyltransferase n=1 Tax=Blautia luti TaxID=89014 RepID=UPI0015701D56|nr:DNA (cytosine-5-)-methyltransferase [Blautia luti]NSK43419.1 DNA (cytosine-5-)-methyltransferase [Blautia luti]